MVLDHLRTAGVHQSRKADSIRFTSLTSWPGDYIGAEGRFTEGETERRAAILVGPEFGTLSRMDLVTAAREASEARFDVLVACAFNYDAHASELQKLGPLAILKARMNPDLHMADDLKNTGRGLGSRSRDTRVESLLPARPDVDSLVNCESAATSIPWPSEQLTSGSTRWARRWRSHGRSTRRRGCVRWPARVAMAHKFVDCWRWH
jgi:hypothetical protein